MTELDGNGKVLAVLKSEVEDMKPMVKANHDFRIKAETALGLIKYLLGFTVVNGIALAVLVFN